MNKLIWACFPVVILALLASASTPASAQGDPDHYVIAEDSWNVGPGGYIFKDGIPDCGGGDYTPLLNSAASLLTSANTGKPIPLASLYQILQGVVPQLTANMAGTGAQILDGLFGSRRYANCVPVSVVIPAWAHILHINFFAVEQGGPDPHSVSTSGCGKGRWVPSDPDQNFVCSIGWSAFDRPIVVTQGQYTVVATRFRNWSHNLTRQPTMDVLWY